MAAFQIPANLLEPVRKFLEEKQRSLEIRQKRLMKEDPFSDPDRLVNNAANDSDAYEQFGHERIQAMRDEIGKNIVRIKKALTRIHLGSYGMCEKCGRMIDTDRLAIDPATSHCVTCQKKLSQND